MKKTENAEQLSSASVPKNKKGTGFLRILTILILVGLAGTSIYYFRQYKKIKENPNSIAQEETKAITEKLSKIMDLPQGEDPTLATVSDRDKLKEQEFFKNAENGDKILIYAGAKQAILYRPVANKIIQVAPLIMDQNTQGTTSQESRSEAVNTQEPLRVMIQNGTKIAGLANDMEKKLTSIDGINVVSKGNSQKNDYTKTLVIDLTQNNSEVAKKISQAIGGEVGSLPDGEGKPDNTDILIIAGKKD
ncbi:MAG: LytR C-terminal domain-containing protein [Candidatus Moranbacteria bacterium]|nr:LytR C-terminal domain-containing protein [Candidatus Moranbacteria bacterium]